MIRFLFLILLSLNIFARLVYVTDEVDIPIRSDKTFKDNIIRSVPSGTALNIVQTDNDGWTKIKVEGVEGWIISRYLSNDPPAREELEKLKISYDANKESLQKQTKELEATKASLQRIIKGSEDNKIKAVKAISEKKHIEKTYANALAIEHENNKLKAENLNLRSKIKLLEVSNEVKIEDANRLWFLYGGILVLLSLILGFIIAKLIIKI